MSTNERRASGLIWTNESGGLDLVRLGEAGVGGDGELLQPGEVGQLGDVPQLGQLVVTESHRHQTGW